MAIVLKVDYMKIPAAAVFTSQGIGTHTYIDVMSRKMFSGD